MHAFTDEEQSLYDSITLVVNEMPRNVAPHEMEIIVPPFTINRLEDMLSRVVGEVDYPGLTRSFRGIDLCESENCNKPWLQQKSFYKGQRNLS